VNINVLAVDPGTTTGWALMRDVDPATSPHTECDINMISQQLGGDEYQISHDIYRIIKHVWPVAVVIEDFIPKQLNKQRWFLSPVRIANQLTMLMWEDNRTWLLQMPSLAMSTIPDEYLKSIDMYQPGKPHANDAVRHCLTYIRRVQQKPALHQQMIELRGLDPASPM
jgi:hypothetical protein